MALNAGYHQTLLNYAAGNLLEKVELFDLDNTSYGVKTISWGSATISGNGATIDAADVVWDNIPSGATLNKVVFITDPSTERGYEFVQQVTYDGSGTFTLKDLTLTSGNI